MALGLAGPRGEHQQVVLAGAGALADPGHLLGGFALESFGVVEHAQTALLAVSLQLVALLAAGLAGIRDDDCEHRETVRRELGEDVLYRLHRRNPAIGL